MKCKSDRMTKQAMFNSLNNNINDINDSLWAEINNNNSKIDDIQALHAAARIEMLERIGQRSRKSTRASSRTTSRAADTRQLQ